MKTKMKISIITLVNRPDIYNEDVIDSTIDQKDIIEFIPIYGARSATSGLNEGIRKATNDLLMLVHQDIFFNPGWYEQFKYCLELLDKYNKNFGVIGMAGTDTEGCIIGTHSGCGMDDRDIAQVQTLDCSTIILKKSTIEKYNIKFDENLKFFHGYGEDIALQSIAKGLSVHVINVNIDHKCKWTAGPGFSESWEYISRKWRKIFPKIYTTVGEH